MQAQNLGRGMRGSHLTGGWPLAWSARRALQGLYMLSEILNPHFRHFRRVGIHRLQERFPDGHVALSPGRLPCAVTEDPADSFRRIDSMVTPGELRQIGRWHSAVAGGTAEATTVFAVTPGAIDHVHLMPGSSSIGEREERGACMDRRIPVDDRECVTGNRKEPQ